MLKNSLITLDIKTRHVSLVLDHYFILECCIVGAVHRFYESRRRLFNDQQPGRVEAANKTKKNSKLTALRKQVCVARCSCKVTTSLTVEHK